MLVGCNTLSFTSDGKSDADAVRLLAKAGFKCIDLNLNRYSVRDPISPFWKMNVNQRREYARTMKAVAKECGVYISQIHAPYPTYLPGKRKRQQIFDCVEDTIYMAALMDTPYVVVHPYVPPEFTTPEQVEAAVEMSFEFYYKFAMFLCHTGVRVGIENMFNWDRKKDCPLETVASTADNMCYLIDSLNCNSDGSPFVACLDTGHGMLTGGGNLPYMIKRLGERLQLLHVHDNDGIRDRHWPPYSGIIDWNAFAKALYKEEYQGVISLEVKTEKADLKTAQDLFVRADRLRMTIETKKFETEDK